MSLKTDRPSVKSVTIGSKEPILICEDHFSSSDTDTSISSEEEVGSGSDSDQRVRARPIQVIWEPEDVWNCLLMLEQADVVIGFINNQEFSNLLQNDKIERAGVLLAAWMGKTEALEFLLNNGASANVTDKDGRTPLHLAASCGSYDSVKRLLDAGLSPSVWDSAYKATPIHCAACQGHLSCIKLLIKRGADVNAGLTNKSPLHYAVQSLAPECVKELLEAGAVPNTPQVFTEAPIHVAAAMGSSEIIKLLIRHGAAVNVQCGREKTTALHLSAEEGDIESVRCLLDARADIMALNYKKQTPLHLAVLSQCTETLQLLLNRGADPNASDIDGRTPLHGAIAKASRCDCVRLLLDFGANVNQPDAFGYTPLHLAALNEYSQFVILLINYGGDVTARTNGGISVLTFITRRTPDVIPKYINKLDSSIKLNDHELGDVDCEIKMDFRVLVPVPGKGETALLLNFIEVGHREILKHPLCETFLFLKWRRIRKYFLFSLFYHFLFVSLFTGYTVGVFLRNCPPSRSSEDNCSVPFYVRFMGYLLIALNCLIVAKEIFQLVHQWIVYIKHWENWLQWLIIISVFFCVFPSSSLNIRYNVKTWQHHVAAIGIFFTWLELMMIVGRFPIFGLYIEMFTTVAINFSKFLLAYSCLLIAFGLCFGVLFANYPAFQNLLWGLLKTVIMMSGELEFEDIFYSDDYEMLYPITSHIMFFAFVLLVTLILNNLLVGLAVSDIQGLQQTAGLGRMVRQAELVAHLESMLFSRLLRCAPKKLLKFFYKHALLLKSQHHWALYVRPNDPREERIPADLLKRIYQLVVEQRDKLKARNRRSNRKSKIQVNRKQENDGFTSSSLPLSRLNSNVTNITSSCNANENNIKQQFELLRIEIQDLSKKLSEKIEQSLKK